MRLASVQEATQSPLEEEYAGHAPNGNYDSMPKIPRREAVDRWW